MAKKLSKSKTTKKTTKKTQPKKSNNEDNSSLGVLLLAVAGIVLLVWFGGTGVSSDGTTGGNTGNTGNTGPVDDPVTFCGTEYSSEKAAYDALKYEPQSQLCDEGIKFRSSYIDEE